MEPHGLKPVVPGLPRLAPRNRTAISGVKSRKFLFEKFLGIRYGKILFPERFKESPGLNPRNRFAISGDDNFAILVGVIRRHVVGAESTCSIFLHSRKYRTAPRLFTAFIHGLKSRGILRRRIKALNNFFMSRYFDFHRCSYSLPLFSFFSFCHKIFL